MLPIEATPRVPAIVPAPTMELLAYSWRYVLARIWLFAGLSGLTFVAGAASFFAGRILLHILGFQTVSKSMALPDFLMSGAVNAAASALIVIPIYAGIYGIVFRMLDNDPDPMKGFSVLQPRYASIVAVSLLASAANLLIRFVCWSMMSHSMSTFISGPVSLILGAMVVLALPAVVRFNMKPIDAITYSIRRFAARPVPFFGYYIGSLVLGMAGLLACGVGVILTFGVLIVAPALLLLDANADAVDSKR